MWWKFVIQFFMMWLEIFGDVATSQKLGEEKQLLPPELKHL
jgi:hypothetical protein